MTVLGIDVSHHQGSIDWHGVAASDAKFAYIKATEGIFATDMLFGVNWAGARDSGLLHGAYHFAHPGLDPVVQAMHFATTIQCAGPSFGELPPCLDLEVSDGRNANAVLEWAIAFVRAAEAKLGRQLLIYTGNFWQSTFGDKRVPELQRMLWIARYSREPPEVPGNWARWDFWQFTDGQSGAAQAIPGVRGPCDANWFRGELTELQALQQTAPAPQPPPLDDHPVLIWPHVPPISGQAVTEFQTQAKKLGFAVDVDGIYGPQSKAACIALERHFGLPPDGVVSKPVWDALEKGAP